MIYSFYVFWMVNEGENVDIDKNKNRNKNKIEIKIINIKYNSIII